MDLQALNAELVDDPESRGYSTMSDQEAADDLNLPRKSRDKVLITGAEAYNLTDSTEYANLTGGDAARSEWLALCAIEWVDPFGPAASRVAGIFPPGGATIAALQAFRVESVSRAVELELGFVTAQHVRDARAI